MPRPRCSNRLELILDEQRRGLWAALLVPVRSQRARV